MGARAIPELVERIVAHRGGYDAAALLPALIADDPINMLASLLVHPDVAVRDAAVCSLATTGDPRAIPYIVEDGKRNAQLAIRALGDLGVADGASAVRELAFGELGDTSDPAVIAKIRAHADESGDIFPLLTVCATAASLAKLADFSMCSTARALATFDNKQIPEASLVRIAAVAALDVMVGPGIAPVLEQCCRDRDGEVAEDAMRAELHLGRIRAVDHWLEIFERDDGRVNPAAHFAVKELTGSRPPEGAEEARAWWAKRVKRYDPNVCYRFGIPAQPSRLVRQARQPGSKVVRQELQQILGLPFLEASLWQPPTAEIAALDAWWHEHAGDFPFGKLHRWGRTYEPDACD